MRHPDDLTEAQEALAAMHDREERDHQYALLLLATAAGRDPYVPTNALLPETPLGKALKVVGEHYRYQASYSILKGDGVAIPQDSTYKRMEYDGAFYLMRKEGFPDALIEYALALSQ